MPEKVNYVDVDPVGGGLHFLRDPLNAENLGVSVLDVPADWSGMAHDNADEGQEEIYVLVEGAATVTVGGEEIEMETGDAVRLDPGETGELETDEDIRARGRAVATATSLPRRAAGPVAQSAPWRGRKPQLAQPLCFVVW